ncbi:hypothetical protein Micbo1qcDRAFT_167018, partial [Microdochium bolleyi]
MMAPSIAQAAEVLTLAGLATTTALALITFAMSSGADSTSNDTRHATKLKELGIDNATNPRYRSLVPALVAASYAAQVAITIAQIAYAGTGNDSDFQAPLFYAVIVLMVWLLVCQQAAKPSSHTLVRLVSASTLVFETPLLVLAALTGLRDRLAVAALACSAARILPLLFLVASHAATQRNSDASDLFDSDDESRAFLPSNGSRTTAPGASTTTTYGAIPTSSDSDDDGSDTYNSDDEEFFDDSDEEDTIEIKKQRAKRLKEKGGWWGYLGDFATFLPFLIPRRDDRKVQA